MATIRAHPVPVRRPGRFLRFHGIAWFFMTQLRVQLHESTAIVSSVIVQAVILIFVTILAPGYLGVALIGALLFSVFQMGQRVQNEAAFIRIDHKLNELYLASPLTADAYFLGMAGGILVAYFPPVVILGAVTALLIPMSLAAWSVLVVVAAAVWLFTVSIGYVISTLFKDMRAIWPYASLFFNLFGVLPPVFYPIRLFLRVLRPLALLIPPSSAAALVDQVRSGGILSSGEILLAVSGLSVTAFGMFLFAVYWARRTVREK